MRRHEVGEEHGARSRAAVCAEGVNARIAPVFYIRGSCWMKTCEPFNQKKVGRYRSRDDIFSTPTARKAFTPRLITYNRFQCPVSFSESWFSLSSYLSF